MRPLTKRKTNYLGKVSFTKVSNLCIQNSGVKTLYTLVKILPHAKYLELLKSTTKARVAGIYDLPKETSAQVTM